MLNYNTSLSTISGKHLMEKDVTPVRYIIDDLIPIYNRKGYRWAETGPQLEDNVKELSQWKPLNPETIKRRRCFTKMI